MFRFDTYILKMFRTNHSVIFTLIQRWIFFTETFLFNVYVKFKAKLVQANTFPIHFSAMLSCLNAIIKYSQ